MASPKRGQLEDVALDLVDLAALALARWAKILDERRAIVIGVVHVDYEPSERCTRTGATSTPSLGIEDVDHLNSDLHDIANCCRDLVGNNKAKRGVRRRALGEHARLLARPDVWDAVERSRRRCSSSNKVTGDRVEALATTPGLSCQGFCDHSVTSTPTRRRFHGL